MLDFENPRWKHKIFYVVHFSANTCNNQQSFGKAELQKIVTATDLGLFYLLIHSFYHTTIISECHLCARNLEIETVTEKFQKNSPEFW